MADKIAQQHRKAKTSSSQQSFPGRIFLSLHGAAQSKAGYGLKGASVKTTNPAFPVIPAALAARFEFLPPTLSIPQVSEFFQKKTPTVRKQISRGVFPVCVRQIDGGEQFVLLTDLIVFCENGIPQEQPQLVKRSGRNKFGRNGNPDPAKRGRGRPTHASRELAVDFANTAECSGNLFASSVLTK